MPGDELTPEERIESQGLTERMEEQEQKHIDSQPKKLRVSLEVLLQTRIDPSEDRVVVWADPVAEVTESGIIKPKEVVEKERPLTGTIIAVGPGKKVEEKVTHAILLQILRHGTDIGATEFDKFKEMVMETNIPYRPGDRVLYGRFAGTPVNCPDTQTPLLIIRPGDIFGKI